MSQLSGKAFDRAYIQHMVSGHEHAIRAFADEVQHGQNQMLKGYAEKTLPTLKGHEAIAKFDTQHRTL